ncbi:MAG TPA: hypothetical protein VIF62_18170 [Labilithrix sp.]
MRRALVFVALVGCRDRTPASTAVAAPRDAAEDVVAIADAAAAPETIAWKEYFSLEQRRDDVANAYEQTFAKMTDAPLASLDGAVVLCRVAVVEPAPLPTSKWDRANGRDLVLDVVDAEGHVTRIEGPLGSAAIHARLDDAIRLAHTAQVRWDVRDRDQQQAYPWHTGVDVGTFEVPAEAHVPLHATAAHLAIDCKGAPLARATRMLLPEADKALDDAEAKADDDVRDVRQLADVLGPAADRIRIGEALGTNEDWTQREERLRGIVRRHRARAEEAWDALAPLPVGSWGSAAPGVSARVRDWACPPVPKGADPGSLNPEQREGCGLVVEMKASVHVAFDPNRWGEAYACRIVDPVRIEALRGPDRTDGVCTLGVRRGAQWIKGTVVLSASEPTTFVLGGTSFGRALRIGIGKGSIVLAVPPPP